MLILKSLQVVVLRVVLLYSGVLLATLLAIVRLATEGELGP